MSHAATHLGLFDPQEGTTTPHDTSSIMSQKTWTFKIIIFYFIPTFWLTPIPKEITVLHQNHQ